MNDTLQQLWKEEDAARAKNINVDTMLTLNSKKNAVLENEPEEPKTLQKSVLGPLEPIIATELEHSEDVNSGQPLIESESEKQDETITSARSVSGQLINPDIKNLPSVRSETNSDSTLLTSEIIASPSMALLDESANHMFGLMKGLHANQPPAEIRAYDPDRVNSAVACANTIYKIMRLKLDAIKVQRKLK